MIAFEVKLNGKRACIAGAEDLAVLFMHVTAVGKLGSKTLDGGRDLHYSVGGLTGRAGPSKDVHVRWKTIAPLHVGDVVQVKVVEAKKADRPKTRERTVRRARHARR